MNFYICDPYLNRDGQSRTSSILQVNSQKLILPLSFWIGEESGIEEVSTVGMVLLDIHTSNPFYFHK